MNPLDTLASVEKLIAFFVEQHNTVLPHSAFAGQTPDEMYTGAGVNVPEELQASREAARLARVKTNKALTCEACEHWTAGKQAEEPAA